MSSTPQVKPLTPVAPDVTAPPGLIVAFLDWFGEFGIFFWRVLRSGVTPPYEFAEFFRQLDEVGSKSLPLVAAAGGAIGRFQFPPNRRHHRQ